MIQSPLQAPFRIRVPASTSNLGPGFDCLGLAVDRYLELTWDPARDGTSATGVLPPAGFGNLLDRSRASLGLPERGQLGVSSEIPVGRGLGSSAALRIALAALRQHLRGGAVERTELLRSVSDEEGHPDNVAPALMGGLVAASHGPEGVDAVPLGISDQVGLAFAAPRDPLSTEEARRVLPAQVDLAVAVRTVGRMARLIPALAVGDGDGIRRGLVDEIHVPPRLRLIPGSDAVARAALDAGAWGCTISGAGSGMIALGPVARMAQVRDAMHAAFLKAEVGGPADALLDEPPAFVLQVDYAGAIWE